MHPLQGVLSLQQTLTPSLSTDCVRPQGVCRADRLCVDLFNQYDKRYTCERISGTMIHITMHWQAQN